MAYKYTLSWKLLIIRLLSEYFATLRKILHLQNVPYFFSNCTFFLRKGEGPFLDKDQISSGEGKIKG